MADNFVEIEYRPDFLLEVFVLLQQIASFLFRAPPLVNIAEDQRKELSPAYLVRAPYSVWKGLLQGKLDPIEAVLRRQIRVEGDMQPLIERMQHRAIAERVLAQLETEFLDDRITKSGT